MFYLEYSHSKRLRNPRKTDYGVNEDYTQILSGKNIFDLFVSLYLKTDVTNGTFSKV